MGYFRREVAPDWYATAFDATTGGLMWAEQTGVEVDRLLQAVEPPPGARVLDLGCGAGRHAIELARRGFDVIGVDVSTELVEIAGGEAGINEVDVEFLLADLRDLDYSEAFDVVLNLHDGAIGYLEDDAENRRVFETIARALRPGGANFAQVPNVLYAEAHFPQRTWLSSEQAVELLDRHWNPEARCMEGEMTPILIDDFHFGLTPVPFRKRLYTVDELREIYASLGMTLTAVLGEDGKPHEPTPDDEEIFAVARKMAPGRRVPEP